MIQKQGILDMRFEEIFDFKISGASLRLATRNFTSKKRQRSWDKKSVFGL